MLKKTIKIEYMSGDSAEYTAYPPDFAKWEKTTGKDISEFAGIWDILYVAHSAYKREAAGNPTKPLEVWMESIVDVVMGSDNPKAITQDQ